MRWGIAAVGCVGLLACGARSEIAGDAEFGVDAGGENDATIDAAYDATHDSAADAKDAAQDGPADAVSEATLCCDDGFKQSGCRTCAQDETCWNKVGTCWHAVTNCGPSNCNGCCETSGWCADGLEVGSCGNHGQLCQTCFDSKTKKVIACIADDAGAGGTCLGGPTCTSQNCLPGCCNGDLCMLGDQDSLCGNGSGACVDCTQGGGTCENQACVFPHQ